MLFVLVVLCCILTGLFLNCERKKQYVFATILKGLASFCFVIIGLICSPGTHVAKLIVCGLILGCIRRLMELLGIKSEIRRSRHSCTKSKPCVAENILKRDFFATAPNQKWTTDVTEFRIPMDDCKLYLSAILDLYDRSIVSYVLSFRNDNLLVFDTFDKAVEKYPDAHPLYHSDRGFQYTSKIFQDKLLAHNPCQGSGVV